jgi:hypothetical protein
LLLSSILPTSFCHSASIITFKKRHSLHCDDVGFGLQNSLLRSYRGNQFLSGNNCFLLPWFFFAVVIIARTQTTKLHRKTQIKTHPHTHKKKERRASACGFPNPNSVVELKGGRRASVFSFFHFCFGETSPNFDLKNLISTYLLYTKGFFIEEKNRPKFTRFQRKIKSQVAIFL